MLGVQAGELSECRFRALRRNTVASYTYVAVYDMLYNQAINGPYTYDTDYQPIKQHDYPDKSPSCNLLTASSPGVLPYSVCSYLSHEIRKDMSFSQPTLTSNTFNSETETKPRILVAFVMFHIERCLYNELVIYVPFLSLSTLCYITFTYIVSKDHSTLNH